MKRHFIFFLAAVFSCAATACLPGRVFAEAPGMFGPLRLVQEIQCGADHPEMKKDGLFAEFPAENASSGVNILGKTCRVMAPSDDTPKFFAYRMGKGYGLQAGRAYVLCVEYPGDVSRAMFVHNGGNEAVSGFATGEALGDTLVGRYVNHNPESLKYPLSGKYEQWTSLFFLHDRFPELQRPRGAGERKLLPEDGFWVIISQSFGHLDPLSAGVAVSRIALYEVLEPEKMVLNIHYPPAELPRRHIFWREEMADGVIHMGHSPAEKDETLRGMKDPVQWYEHKILWARALGINTFCKDLLEFGHNQGWDSEKYGGSAWVNQSPTPDLWEKLVELAAKYDYPILPYYEYYGSIGGDPEKALGPQKRAKRLNDENGENKYTHIWWCESANVDITAPDTLTDFEKMLELTVTRFKNDAKFLGAWIRTRPTAIPVSFHDKNLAQFAREANGGMAVTRDDLRKDETLLKKYYAWWFLQRAKFLEGVAGYLRKNVDADCFVLFTADSSEPGVSLPSEYTGAGKKDSWRYKVAVVNEDHEKWEKILAEERYEKRFVKSVPFSEVAENDWHLKSTQRWADVWGGWENQHSTPPADPEHYKNSPDVMLSYTINRAYSSVSPEIEKYRTGAGFTVVKHFPLNEHELRVKEGQEDEDPTGYFVADVERSGDFCMIAEVRAMAFGDPTNIGYLAGNTFQRGFPDRVQAFNAAFLALPAIRGEQILADAETQKYARRYAADKHGTYYAVTNIALTAGDAVIKNLSPGTLTDCVTGEKFPVKNGAVTIPMKPASLRAFRDDVP